MHSSSVLQCPESDRVVFALLFCFALLSSLILIANPGFFNHDELQRADHVLRYGFEDYLAHYVKLHRGNEFGDPVRPVSFFIQGVVSLFLPTYAFLVHLVDVLIHGAVASMLYVATRHIHGSRQFAWAAAIIFLISPLVTFSVGWAAALMDRLYILFGLVAFAAAHSYITRQCGWTALFAIVVASVLAILSKETALILPGTLIVYLIFSLESIRSKRLWIAFGVWTAPVFLYFLYRAPALINSFSGKMATPYSASLANVPEGILVYFTYPFLPSLSEAGNWILQSSASMWAAGVTHLVLLILLWCAFSYRAVLAYLAGYLIFVIPVLPISNKGAHYLYGSGLVFSLALAALLTLKWRRGHRLFVAIPIMLLVVAIYHSLQNQIHIYKVGSCMNRAMNSIESAYLASGSPAKMTILIGPSAPGHVLYRFTTGRDQINSYFHSYFPVSFQIVDWDKRNDVRTGYLFNSDCLIYQELNH